MDRQSRRSAAGYAASVLGPQDFLRLTLDPIRLAVLGASVRAPVDVEALAGDLHVPIRKVQEALGRLQSAGLITSDRRLDQDALRGLAQSLPREAPIDPELLAAGWSPEEADTLSRFFSGSRLKQIPTQQTKRRVVLERLAQEFEPGIRYQEKEVNFTLQLFFADYAALRRYLIDEGFMTRADGVYWRTGGRYPTMPD